MLLNMTKAFISEILAVQAHPRVPEVTKKPEIFQFFPIFDPQKKIFENFFASSFSTFYCESFAIKIIQIGSVVYKIQKIDQKNTLAVDFER